MTHARQLLVTSALPYANGPLHIGHLLGYIQADIWVRARRMAGDTVHFVCADDAHGTAIMLAAEKAGITPEEFIKDIQAGHEKDFATFHVDFDFYHTTHSPENQELAGHIFTRLRDTGKIARREVRQLYDPIKEMFLPDRYIKGECPVCATPDQYGDNCENCGATYSPTDLKNPRSVVSGATPELRDSEHYFFKVGEFAQFLREWLAGDVAHASVKAKLKEWLDAEGGVRDWDISRDAPYFGFPIPDAPGKFFYVWLDAPVGYLASFKKYCASEKGRANGLTPATFKRFLEPSDPDFIGESELHHFIGKDIVNFHGLFWPAMLQGAGYREPTALHVNGYLTVNGAKMSKSRGTFIQARTYLDAGLNAEYLRYYFATMLGPAPTDIDLDLKAFEDRVNSHLVGKFVNIASRCAGFIEKHFDGRLAADIPAELLAHYQLAKERLEQASLHKRHYQEGDFAQIARDVMNEADYINGLIAGWQPWKLAKDLAQHKLLHQVCTLAINFFRLLTIYLKPIIPATAMHIETFLGEKLDHFLQAETLLLGTQIQPFQSLITRIDAKNIETMIEASKDSLAVEKPVSAAPTKKSATAKAETNASPAIQSPPAIIAMDDFAKLDLRIGKVLMCEFVEGSDKLLRFQLDAGELGQRQIFSGIRGAYAEPEKLVGRNVVFIANLAPRKMRFGVSEGMILSAGGSDGALFLLDADAGAAPGMTVK